MGETKPSVSSDDTLAADELQLVALRAKREQTADAPVTADEFIKQGVKPKIERARDEGVKFFIMQASTDPGRFDFPTEFFAGLNAAQQAEALFNIAILRSDAQADDRMFAALRAAWPTESLSRAQRATQLKLLDAHIEECQRRLYARCCALENLGANVDWCPLVDPKIVLEFRSTTDFNRKRAQGIKDASDSVRSAMSRIDDRRRALSESIRAAGLIAADGNRPAHQREDFEAKIKACNAQLKELLTERENLDPVRRRRQDILMAVQRFLRDQGVDMSFLF